MSRKGSIEERQRLNRFFFKDNAWYVEIRDGIKGPFPRRQDATQFLAGYVHNKRVQEALSTSDGIESSQVVAYSDSSVGFE